MSKRIAVLTSGGDAPGMNAAIRAVVRSGLHRGWAVEGVRRGYAGLLAGDFTPLGSRDVSGILQLGGTILGSARSPEFRSEQGRENALGMLRQQGIEALIVIGGNGSQAGALSLAARGFPVVGVASTIDNDLAGSDVALGVDTALNIALEATDRLKTTAASHHRAFLVEVMGRDCGYLALAAGVAGGAEVVVIPEFPVEPEAVMQAIHDAHRLGKAHALVVIAEGAEHDGGALARYADEHRERLGFEVRTTTLGHVQRGGAPGAFDRLLGSRLGAGAVEQLAAGRTSVLVGWMGGRATATPLEEIAEKRKVLDPELLELARTLV